jgi:hypothetical protein
MTNGETVIQPGEEEVAVPFRERSAYLGYKAFGGGDGAVLVAPKVARELRSAAEFATQERRITGGLLYGRGWADEQGAYVIVDRYLEAGPGENSGDRLVVDGPDDFTLSEADVRLLHADAARTYSAFLEVGWWRSLGGLGDFGPGDFETQAELVGPDGVGLLVYGSGPHWGTAYLGPDGHAPDSAGTLVAASGADQAADFTEPEPEYEPEPELPTVVDLAAGESLVQEQEQEQEPLPPADAVPVPGGLPDDVPLEARPLGARGLRGPRGQRGPRRAAPRVASRVRVPTRMRPARQAAPVHPGDELPSDVMLVVGALAVVVVVAAIIIGVLVSSVIVALIIGAIGLLVLFFTIRASRR